VSETIEKEVCKIQNIGLSLGHCKTNQNKYELSTAASALSASLGLVLAMMHSVSKMTNKTISEAKRESQWATQ
jgi:hypothetical protein